MLFHRLNRPRACGELITAVESLILLSEKIASVNVNPKKGKWFDKVERDT